MKFRYDKQSKLLFLVNKLLPFPGYTYMNILGIMVTRIEDCIEKMSESSKRHEVTHTKQQIEMLFIGFYIWYVLEWLVRLIGCRNAHKAYRNISFEQEARFIAANPDYVRRNFKYGWLKWLFK